jgi:choline dehydrogenase-like flavoprotein
VCGLGPFDYDAREWIATEAGETLPNLRDDRIITRIYQFGLARHFLDEYPKAVALGQNTTLIRNATVTELVVDASRKRLVGVRICSMDLRCVGMVRARAFVLATGAIENARLLLMSPVSSGPDDWLGRCFMEHPRDYALTLFPKRDSFFSEAVFFDQHVARDGTSIMGRLALTPEIQRKEGLLQASATLLPNHARPLPGTRMLKEFLRATGLRRSGDYPVGRERWSSHFEGEARPSVVRVLLNLEQAPNPANRVILGNRRDKFGMPLPELHWRWRADEQRLLGRIRSIFATALESEGRVQIFPAQTPDPNAHHHAGTTRMSHEARHGVIDADCRVHGIENLFVAGASTFPTAGMANPTLTIVALALRLASHLRAELRS